MIKKLILRIKNKIDNKIVEKVLSGNKIALKYLLKRISKREIGEKTEIFLGDKICNWLYGDKDIYIPESMIEKISVKDLEGKIND